MSPGLVLVFGHVILCTYLSSSAPHFLVLFSTHALVVQSPRLCYARHLNSFFSPHSFPKFLYVIRHSYYSIRCHLVTFSAPVLLFSCSLHISCCQTVVLSLPLRVYPGSPPVLSYVPFVTCCKSNKRV